MSSSSNVLFTLGLAVALCGCGSDSDVVPAAQAETAAPADIPGLDLTATDPMPGSEFSNAAASNDAFQIAASRLALKRSSNSRLKFFAHEMLSEHAASTAKLVTAAGQASPVILPDPTLPADLQVKLDALTAKSGVMFDRSYRSLEIEAHEATLSAFNAYAKDGDVGSLKEYAAVSAAAVAQHLAMARRL